MKSFQSILSVSLLGLATVLAGCAADATTGEGTEEVAAVATDTTAVAPAAFKEVGRHGRRGGGPEFLVRAALKEDIGLSADQKSVLEGLVAKKPAADRPAGARKAHGFDKARATAMAAAIRSGKVESMTRPEPTAEQKAAHQAKRAEHLASVAKTLDTLHSTLTPEQRTKLVAAIENHVRPEKNGKQQHAERSNKGHGKKGEMFADLQLTDAQKQAVHAAMQANHPKQSDDARKAAFQAMRAERKDKLESFATDAFDATAFVTPKAKADKHVAKESPLAALVAVLQPEQREKLAIRFEQGPQMHQRAVTN